VGVLETLDSNVGFGNALAVAILDLPGERQTAGNAFSGG